MSEGNENRVDLGLSGLLDSEEKAALTPIIEAPTLEPIAEQPLKEVASISPAQALWNEKQFEKIINLFEPALDRTGNEGLEARLWWARAHIAKGDLPISFLSAPIETAFTDAASAKDNKEIFALASVTASELINRLSLTGQHADYDTLVKLAENLGAKTKEVVEDNKPKTVSNLTTWEMGESNSKSMPVTKLETPQHKSFNSEVVEGSSWKKVAIFFLVLITLSLGGGYFVLNEMGYNLLTLKEAEVAPEKVALATNPETSMRAPEPTRMQKVGTLGALFYDMASATPAVKPTLAAAEAPKNEAKANDQAPSTTTTTQKVKEKVNTDGPIEGPEFREKLTKPERSPEFDGNRKPIVEGYPVEKYPEGKTFQVLAKTSVLSDPSDFGRVIGQLFPGDRVYVEAKVGRWLRLRSRKGKGGFVPAENIADASADEFTGKNFDR